MLDGGPPARRRPTWRRRVQDRVTIPGLIAAGLMAVLIVVLIIIGRTAPSLGGNGTGPSGSATPIFTPPGVSGVATATPSGSASPGSSASSSASASAGTTPTPGTTARPSFTFPPTQPPTAPPTAPPTTPPATQPPCTQLVTPCPH